MQQDLIALAGILLALALGAWGGRRMASPVAERHAFESRSYFGALDGLRAVSVLAVIWYHVVPPGSLELLNHGNKGVDLFFAISGFLVTTLLLREHARRGAISLRNFYIRRTLRIFPLYYAVLAVYCVLVFATQRGTPKAAEFWGHLPAFLTYTSNWFVQTDPATGQAPTFYIAWSLATEEQFYLFWPALLVLGFWLTRRSWPAAVAAVALVVVSIVAWWQPEATLLYRALASLAPAILFGAGFAVLLHDKRSCAALFPVLAHRWAVPATLAAVVLALQFGANGILIRFLLALLVVTLCVRERTVLHPALSWRPAVFIGGISYGMYLMHMLAANAVRKVLGHAMGVDVFLATAALVTVMAFLSYRYFEAPILRLKSRFQAPPRRGDEDGTVPGGRARAA